MTRLAKTFRRKCCFDLRQLKRRCNADLKDFYSEGKVVETADGPYIFRDNGCKVLAVAHLDTVNHKDHFVHSRKKGQDVVYSTGLDDRLGAHIILDILPAMGLDYDILLTDGEESARSTAAWFMPPRQYNWIFQYDRSGTDVVMYSYETRKLSKLCEQYGYWVGNGSFSDISSMEHLGCKAFNFGTGYYNPHSLNAHCVLSDTWWSIKRFCKFFQDQAGRPMRHVAKGYSIRWAGKRGKRERYPCADLIDDPLFAGLDQPSNTKDLDYDRELQEYDCRPWWKYEN
jgi:hypothetical protein